MINNKRFIRRLSVGTVCFALALGATASPAAARGGNDVQHSLDALVEVDHMAGAVVRSDDRHGDSATFRAGTAERGSGLPMVDGRAHYRAASLTKPVVAATVLSMAEDHLIDLRAPVERYLPGQLRGTGDGAGIDGRHITIRHLLQQVSGLPEFSDVVDEADGPYTPAELLEYALHRTPAGQPGERFSYANTNYLVLGLVIDRVTGRDFRDVVTDRVLLPLKMSASYWPEVGERGIRGDHAHTYALDPQDPTGGDMDTTDLDGHSLGASGGLMSTPADLDRFWHGLFAGELLRPASVRAMTSHTVSVEESGWPAGSRYGLGMARAKLPCAGEVWMHGGGVRGITTLSGHARNGRSATIYVTGNLGTAAGGARLQATFDQALCQR